MQAPRENGGGAADAETGRGGGPQPPAPPMAMATHMTVPLPEDKIPSMDWRCDDVPAAWARFKTRMNYFLLYTNTPKDKTLATVLLLDGEEAINRWETLKFKCTNDKDIDEIWQVFGDSFEKSGSFWQYRDQYMSDYRQQQGETVAELDLAIRALVTGCQFKEEKNSRLVDLLFHATKHYELKKAIQECKPEQLTYDKMIEEAKRIERSKVDAANYKGKSNPPFANHTVSRRTFQSPGQRQRRNSNGKACTKCGFSHEWRNCPAFGINCKKCQGQNHYARMCTSKSKKSQERGRSPGRQHGKGITDMNSDEISDNRWL